MSTGDDQQQSKEDMLKAAAWDMQKIADRHVARLREVGEDDLADLLEKFARNTKAVAEEHSSS